MVAKTEKAWHAGVSMWKGKNNVNDNSIGIEIVNPGSGGAECYPIYYFTFTSKAQTSLPECEKHLFTLAQF